MGLRLLFIVVYLLIMIPLIIKHPFWGVPALILDNIVRPVIYGAPPWLQTFNLLVMVTIISTIIKMMNGEVKFQLPTIAKLLLIFYVMLWISGSQAMYSKMEAQQYANDILKNIVITILIINLVRSYKELKIVHWAISLGILKLTYGQILAYQRQTTGFEHGGDERFACMLCMAIPFVLFNFIASKGKEKWISLASLAVMMVGVVALNNRASFLAIIVLVMIVLSRVKQKIKFVMILFVALIIFAPMIPQHYMDRMGTIFVKNEDGAERDGSSQTRLTLWPVALQLVSENPLFGIGLENFAVYGYYHNLVAQSKEYRVAGIKKAQEVHNLFLQILVGGGIMSFLPYMVMMILCFHKLRKARLYSSSSSGSEYSDQYQFAIIFEAALIMFVINSLFVNTVQHSMHYYYYAFPVVLTNIMQINEAKKNNTKSVTNDFSKTM